MVVGGAGFLGSHFLDRLLGDPNVERVTVYDNFSSGKDRHFAHHQSDPRLVVVRADVHQRDLLTAVMTGHDCVIHLASNPDIARAVTEPDIDFREGSELTNHIVEAMRKSGVRRALYASGSGIYGDLGEKEIEEDHGSLLPISTYGASKLAGEALFCAYAHMFDMKVIAFRFANVVGCRQTHGVGFDFVRKLHKDPHCLYILGDGTQRKSYVHARDVVEAVLCAADKTQAPFDAYNIATDDAMTVRQIADAACRCVGLDPAFVSYRFSGGDRGWKGDVPVVRLSSKKIRALGWRPTMSSRQALIDAMSAILSDLKAGDP
jgi:UDP-glucose 4-epimerase